MAEGENGKSLVHAATDLLTNYVANNHVSPEELPELLGRLHGKMLELRRAEQSSDAPVEERAMPEVEAPRGGSDVQAQSESAQDVSGPGSSIGDKRIKCLECGRQFRTLKRHLNETHGITPDQYKAKWGLPREASLVCKEFHEDRTRHAKEVGLGAKRKATRP